MHRVIEYRHLGANQHQLVIEAPDIARAAEPGQFVIVRTEERSERIPLTIADFDKNQGTITLVILAVGFSTEQLCELRAGDHILDVAGPLGHPSELENFGTVVFVGGGVGIAPLYPQVKAFKASGNKVIVILGVRSKDLLFWEEDFKSHCDQILITSNDGSVGKKGFGTDALMEVMNSEKVDRVIAIGPAVMMRAVAEKTGKIPTVVSLNPIMVDGTGMCGACRCTAEGKTRFACVDGPEFDGHTIDWDELVSRQRMYSEEEKMVKGENKVPA
ncbi:MAG TPA: sulfide/dihydroorotate dehydrogenase-like FAD/NAD-binding protein [Cyanobacteria bacterium UBA8530]|nr:sulfide/dihydroorotate dehydrogenase-like FAD/NAD-binding protein [Cyanobacteria bacterium UBA8530]